MKNKAPAENGVSSQARKAASAAGVRTLGICLATVDWYHRTALRIKEGERAVAPTKRIAFSADLRRRVTANQGIGACTVVSG